MNDYHGLGTLGILGLGNMGKALIKGVLSKKICKKEHICGYDIVRERAEEVGDELGIHIETNLLDIYQRSDIIIVAVKPQDIDTLLNAIADYSQDKGDQLKIIVSICAGISIKHIANIIGEHRRIARVMPNTPFLVGAGASAVAFNGSITDNDKNAVIEILESGSIVFEVDEKLINPITALSGSSPAFVFIFIEALADGGVKAGIPRDMALKLAAQSVFGAAKLMIETNTHPAILKDMVSSPAGTTIEGISTLENAAFRGSIIDSVFDSYKRAEEI